MNYYLKGPGQAWLVSGIALCLLVGCNQRDPALDADTPDNPFIRAGKSLMEAKKYGAAIKEFEKALAANPDLATPHLHMAMIYDRYLADRISAIYHYQRYLSKSPESSESVQVRQLMENAQKNFAVEFNPAREAGELGRLSRENTRLKQDLENVRAILAERDAELARVMARGGIQLRPPNSPVSDSSGNRAIGIPPPPPPPPSTMDGGTDSEVRIYKVEKGDTLWNIAKKFYPNDIQGGIRRISEANADTLPNPSLLRVGQTLRIP